MNVFQKISVLSVMFLGATLSYAAEEPLVRGVGVLPIVKIKGEYFVMMGPRQDGTLGTIGGKLAERSGPATRERAAYALCRKSSYTSAEALLGMGDIIEPVAQAPLYTLYGSALDGKRQRNKYNVLIPAAEFAQALWKDDITTVSSANGCSYPIWEPTRKLMKENKRSLLGYVVGAISGWEGIDLASSSQEAQDH